jgi:hypothetical protein
VCTSRPRPQSRTASESEASGWPCRRARSRQGSPDCSYGVDVGSQLPMIFAAVHPWPVRRRDVKVMRLKELPRLRDGVAAPEHCWLVAASTLNLLELVTAGDSRLRLRRTTLARLQAAVQMYSGRGPCRGGVGAGTGGLPAGDLAAALPNPRRAADAGMQT